MALHCYSINTVRNVNESEERMQCKIATARKPSSPLCFVEVSAHAVGGVWRAKSDQALQDGLNQFFCPYLEFLPTGGVQVPVLQCLNVDLNVIYDN